MRVNHLWIDDDMKSLPKIVDPIYNQEKTYTAFEQWLLKFISDKRDLPFIYLCVQLTLMIVPFAIFLYTPILKGGWWWLAALGYVVLTLGIYMGPFILMLHNTCHRRFFKQEYNIGNYYIPWILGFFFGQSPETYFSHHIGMHHAENNQLEDRSSTMMYQRDNFWHFMHYFGTFLLIGAVHLVEYFKSKSRKKFVQKVIRGELTFVLLCVALSFISFKATMIVFVTPFVVSRFGMMAGNWAQHAFIKADDPENNYVNSITIINSTYNRRCFNDGYHIGHHLRPHMHWTDMPKHFLKNLDNYSRQKAIIFEGMDFVMVWFWLMTKRYDVLANKFINVNNTFQTKEEVMALLRERTRRSI